MNYIFQPKRIVTIIFLVISIFNFAQPAKVAILDFENTSGKTEYDALSKAISSMLITDLANNIHPKKVEFFERSQLNKLLDEQKLQKSKDFDTKTAVDFGKLSGVNYVFVGSVFVLDGTCNFSSKLVDVQTSKILLAKEVSGTIVNFLQLKSQLAEAIAIQLNNPITLDPSYKDQSTTLSTINQYGKIVTTMDQGDVDKAEQLRSVFQETTPDFKYFSDIKDEIERLKQRVSELENVTDILTDNFDLGDKAEMKKDFTSAIKYFEKFINNPGDQGFVENKKLYAYGKLALCQFLMGDYANALNNSQKAQLIYKFYPEANETELMSLIKLEKHSDAENKYNFIVDSLTFTNELNFIRQERNNLLVWQSIDGIYYGLQPFENNNVWVYLGLPKNRYSSPPNNEVKIKKLLSENTLKIPESKNKLSQYEKIEAKLLSYNDSLIFSSNQILNFYKLSLLYADELYEEGNIEKYKSHIQKQINRLESFGVHCDDSKRDLTEVCACYKHFEIVSASDNPARTNGADFIKISIDKYNLVFSELNLSNSFMEFENNFHLIYGEFILKYLILLIKENSILDAVKIYNRLIKLEVKDRESYFYNYYWDIILGLRIINEEWNSQTPLTLSEFKLKLDTRIEKDLKKANIPISNWNKVKSEKIVINSGKENIEIDDKLISDKLLFSKNMGVIEDGFGSKISLATEESIWDFYKDSIPAYCFYDFDDSNGEKYGKLYNYWALKLIAKNPPKGWRIATINDFEHIEAYNQIEMGGMYAGGRYNHKLPYLFFGKEFISIEEANILWLNDVPSNEGFILFGLFPTEKYPIRLNCSSCFFSIRLVKDK